MAKVKKKAWKRPMYEVNEVYLTEEVNDLNKFFKINSV